MDDKKGLISIAMQPEVYFETTTSKKIEKAFDLFWDKMDIMKKYKKNKRSFLLHSLPGMGKSALIRHFCNKLKNKKGLCILKCEGNINFKHLSWMFRLPYDEGVKSILVIIEDMGTLDYNLNTYQYDPNCLNFMDGNIDLFRVPTMVVVTTNFAKQLGPQFINRPGRFNQIFKVEKPTDTEIFQLIEYSGGIKLTQKQKEILSGKDLSPDHCIEILIRSELEDISIEKSLESVLKERDGIVDNTIFE